MTWAAVVPMVSNTFIWSVVEVIVINRAEPAWTPPAKGPVRKEYTAVAATVVVVGVVMAIHNWLGVQPWG